MRNWILRRSATPFAAILLALTCSALAQNPLDDLAQQPQPQPQPQAQAVLPGFLKPGSRLTFHGGDSTIAGKRWVRDDDFGYVKFSDGHWYRPEQRHGGGGVGYVQVNILAAGPQYIGADIQNYLNTDAQNDIYSTSGAGAVFGNGQELGDFWVSPVKLAAIANDPDPNIKVQRVKYKLGERIYNALSVRYSGTGRYSSKYYDLESGILLFMGTTDVDPSVNIVDPNGNVQANVRGNATFSHVLFVGVRDTTIPWAADPPPAWVRAGGQLQYQGVNRMLAPGHENLGQLPGQALALGVQFAGLNDGVAMARITQQSDLGHGLPPDQTSVDRAFGSAMFNGLWISPRLVANLQPNQVLDQDPHTRFQWIFAGTQNGAAAIVERGPAETIERFYDLQSGMLNGFRITRQMPIGQSVAEYRLVGKQ